MPATLSVSAIPPTTTTSTGWQAEHDPKGVRPAQHESFRSSGVGAPTIASATFGAFVAARSMSGAVRTVLLDAEEVPRGSCCVAGSRLGGCPPARFTRGVGAHPERTERIVVAGKDSATVPVGTLGSIRKASGLEHLR